jgi:hypothetical protein
MIPASQTPLPGSEPPGRALTRDLIDGRRASAGNCAAGGSYQDRSGHQQAFVISQVNGHWRIARPLAF